MEIRFSNYKYNKHSINLTIDSNTIIGVTGDNYEDFLNIFNFINKFTNISVDKVKLNSKNVLYYNNKIVYIKNIDYNMTIKEYMLYLIDNYKLEVKDINKKIIDSLKIVGLKNIDINMGINDLSTSEKTLLLMACSLVFNPEVIVLNNPYFGLDNKMIKRTNILFNKLIDQYNKTIIIGSNNSNELYKYTKEMIFIRDDNIIRYDKTINVYKDIEFLKDNNFDIPLSVLFTSKVNDKKKVNLNYLQDIRDIIKDIYKHV